VGYAAGNERESARTRVDRILPDDQRDFSVDDVEAFVLVLVEVMRGREAAPAIHLDQRVCVAVLRAERLEGVEGAGNPDVLALIRTPRVSAEFRDAHL